MGKSPLTIQQIKELDRVLILAFERHRKLRQEFPVACHIKFPQIPQALSESLVIAARATLFGPEYQARCGGGKECDVVLTDGSQQDHRVEVKATASNSFQEIKSKDLCADFLVWVDFGSRYEQGTGPIRTFVLPKPQSAGLIAGRIRLPQFKAVGARSDRFVEHRWESLDALLK